MKNKILCKAIICSMILTTAVSCVEEKDLYEPGNNYPYSAYLYPFRSEVQDAVAEIVIKTNKTINANNVEIEVPYLKYNKSWLLMLTQDDCHPATFCRTWAAINGKPISTSVPYPIKPNPQELYYHAAQLQAGDLPPNIINARKSLGSTDGHGNESRFSITATLAPEESWMNKDIYVNPGYSVNYSRFYRQSGLVWNNVTEMLNYGTGIAFHDVKATDVNNPSDILKHYIISQDTITKRLTGRGCKMLAEPNGNKTYVTAALQYPDIQTMAAQTGTVRLYPFQVSDDLKGKLLHRDARDSDYFRTMIESQLQLPVLEREAIHICAHGTDNKWIEFLQWINDNYGKDGDDSVWFPSQEEYYEYNYYRVHGSSDIEQIDENTIKITVSLPSEKYFYYPSITVNLSGIKNDEITSVTSNDAVTGLSYGDYENGLSMNIDCRKYLYNHAVHYVEVYEKDKSDKTKKNDAIYFTRMLKDSPEKTKLLKRVE